MKAELKFSVPCTATDYYYVDSKTLTNAEVKAAIAACDNDPWQAEDEYDIVVSLGSSCDPDTDVEALEWEEEYEERKNSERAAKSM